MSDQERKDFEAALFNLYEFASWRPTFGKYADGDYIDGRTHKFWRLWQAARAALAQQAVPEGWKLVPVEPTPEMLSRARHAPIPAVMLDSHSARLDLDTRTRWAAMLAAAPAAPQAEQQAVPPAPGPAADDAGDVCAVEDWEQTDPRRTAAAVYGCRCKRCITKRRAPQAEQQAGPALTREQFIDGYIKRSEITRQFYDEHLIALPCECGESGCEGWASIGRGGHYVLTHLRLWDDAAALLKAEALAAQQAEREPYGWLFGNSFWEATNRRITDEIKRLGKPLYDAPQAERDPLSREQAIAIARKAAVAARDESGNPAHSYLPMDSGERWEPHEWVVDAIMAAGGIGKEGA